jgi:hypothetical protein
LDHVGAPGVDAPRRLQTTSVALRRGPASPACSARLRDFPRFPDLHQRGA